MYRDMAPLTSRKKTEAGSWRNEETTPALKEALDKFKQAVLDSGILGSPPYWRAPITYGFHALEVFAPLPV